MITTTYVALEPNNENAEDIFVGLPHLEKLCERLGTELDSPTMAPKLSVLSHLRIKARFYKVNILCLDQKILILSKRNTVTILSIGILFKAISLKF